MKRKSSVGVDIVVSVTSVRNRSIDARMRTVDGEEVVGGGW